MCDRNKISISTDETQLILLAELANPTVNQLIQLGYKVYVEIGVSADESIRVMQDMQTKTPIAFEKYFVD